MDLSELRQSIDRIDKGIIELLSKRFKLTEEVGIFKATAGMAAQDGTRESLMMAKIAELAKEGGLQPDYAMTIYRCIIDVAISRHNELRESL
ncbi:MAG: chorismate mutase [Ardenticatenaceae bacterium]